MSPIRETDEPVVRAISRRNSTNEKAKTQPKKLKRCLRSSAKSIDADKDDLNKHLKSNNSGSKRLKERSKTTDGKIDIKRMKMSSSKDKIREPSRQLNGVITAANPLSAEPAGSIFRK